MGVFCHAMFDFVLNFKDNIYFVVLIKPAKASSIAPLRRLLSVLVTFSCSYSCAPSSNYWFFFSGLTGTIDYVHVIFQKKKLAFLK